MPLQQQKLFICNRNQGRHVRSEPSQSNPNPPCKVHTTWFSTGGLPNSLQMMGSLLVKLDTVYILYMYICIYVCMHIYIYIYVFLWYSWIYDTMTALRPTGATNTDSRTWSSTTWCPHASPWDVWWKLWLPTIIQMAPTKLSRQRSQTPTQKAGEVGGKGWTRSKELLVRIWDVEWIDELAINGPMKTWMVSHGFADGLIARWWRRRWWWMRCVDGKYWS